MAPGDFRKALNLRLKIALVALSVAGVAQVYRHHLAGRFERNEQAHMREDNAVNDYQFCIGSTRRKIDEGMDYNVETDNDDVLAIYYLAQVRRNDGTDLSLVREHLLQKRYPVSKLEDDARTDRYFSPAFGQEPSCLWSLMDGYCDRFARGTLTP